MKTLGGMVLALGMAACAAEDSGVVVPKVVVARTATALTSGSVTAVNGTYTGCEGRSGAWSVRVSGAGALDHDELTVIKGDTNCQLAVTELVTSETFVATPPMALGTSYVGTASAFRPAAGIDVAFYANAKLDSASFDSDFQLSIVHSDDPNLSGGQEISATLATVEASVIATVVGAPDYALSFTGGSPLTLQTDVNKVVTSASGQGVMLDGARTGSGYVVDSTLGANPSYAAVALAYNLGSVTAIGGANPAIPVAKFGLVGQNLSTPAVRTVIVSRTVLGVLAYQVFRVTFKAP